MAREDMAWEPPSDSQKNDASRNRDPWGGGDFDFNEFANKFRSYIGGGGGRRMWGVAALAVLLFWGLFGFYQLDQQERAVVLRLGRFLKIEQPGLRWRPLIVDKIHKVNVTKIYSEPYQGHMLTRDENIVQVRITAQYRIAEPRKYVLRVRDPIRSLRHAMESALRHVVGGSRIDEVITFDRQRVAEETRERLQDYMDLYETGIRISQININDAGPPQEVKAAFDDVNKAFEDEARYKNEAEAYANEVVPRARGFARRAQEEAEAYKQQVIARAKGDASRFTQLLGQYELAPEVTRRRLYIDAIEQVLGNVSKVVVDVEEGGSLFYLPLDRLVSERAASDDEEKGSDMSLSPRELRDLARRISEQLGASRRAR